MPSARTMTIKAAKVFTGEETVLENAFVRIEDGTITGVGSTDDLDEQSEGSVVDVGDATVMPGLIDCHVQLMAQNVLTYANYRVATFEQRPELQQMYALVHAQMCLDMGFTTMRDLGWAGPSGMLAKQVIAVRDAVAAGIVAGPRILVAGWAVATGSHLDLIVPGASPRPAGVTADGPYGLRALAREHFRAGADWIKTCASGGGGTDHEQPDVVNHTEEELAAIADEAHMFRKRAACHCFTASAQKRALRAGFDTLEHCVWTDDEAIEGMISSNTPIIPTLLHRTDAAIETRGQIGTPSFVLEKMKKLQPNCFDTFQKVHEAGVTIAMGTDMGLDPEMASNAKELALYVELGMTPLKALRSATGTAARALGIDDVTGTLEAGKTADILVVDGDPTQDITVLQDRARIQLVMRDGEVMVDRREGGRGGAVADQSWAWRRWGG